MSASRLAKVMLDVREGFWLRPVVMLLGGVLIGVVATHFDEWLHDIIASIGRQTVADFEQLRAPPCRPIERGPDAPFTIIRASATGYIQLLDDAAIRHALRGAGRVVRRDAALGDFVFPDSPLVSVAGGGAPAEDVVVAVRDAFTLGSERTNAQDLTFGVRQLVDVALKALSPGINDVTTAVMVVNELGAITGAVARHCPARSGPRRLEADDAAVTDGVYLVTEVSLEEFLELAFAEVIPACATQPRVLRRALDILSTIASVARDGDVARVLTRWLDAFEAALAAGRTRATA